MMKLLLLAIGLSAGRAASAQAAVGVPLGSNILSVRESAFDSAELDLTLNDDKDRVGATYRVCDPSGPADPPTCDTVNFIFPDLHYDRDTNRVMRAEEVVATDRGWRGLRLEPSFRLEAQVVVDAVDDGFNRGEVRRAQVFLVKTP